MEIANSKPVDAGDKVISGQEKNEAESNNQLFTEDPLDNVLVLDVIFNHLEKHDWKSVRLVNKTWHSTLLRRWRDGMVYRVGDSDPKAITTKFLEQQHPQNNPIDSMQFRRHKIRNIKFMFSEDVIILLTPDQTGFWELYGHWLKHLDLWGIRIHRGELLKKLLFELTPSLEELRYFRCICDDIDKLELNTDTQYIPPATLQKNLTIFMFETSRPIFMGEELNTFAYIARFPISWIEFFSKFPHIQRLNLEVDPWVLGTRDLLKLLKAIDIVRKANDNKVLNIDHLETDGFNFANVREHKLIIASLPISTLDINVKSLKYDDTVFLIQVFQLTLRDLSLTNHNDPEEGFPINILPKGLTRLSLMGKFFSSLEFLAYTPKLETLILDPEHLANMVESTVYANMGTLPPLVKLNFECSSYNSYKRFTNDPERTHLKMELLAKLFPNLKKCCCNLPFVVDAEGFKSICRGFPNLEYLSVSVGFGREDFFVKNLVQLQGLRSLIICSSKLIVTDNSIYKGFLKLPVLNILQVLSRGLAVTEEGLAALKEKLKDGLQQFQ